MSFSGLCWQVGVVMRQSAVSTNRHGHATGSWAVAGTMRGRLDVGGREIKRGKELVISEGVWFALPGQIDPELSESDRLVVGGETWEVLFVGPMRGRRGATHHLEVDVRRAD